LVARSYRTFWKLNSLPPQDVPQLRLRGTNWREHHPDAG